MMSAKFDENKIQEQFHLYQLKREEKVKAEAAEKLEQERHRAEVQATIAKMHEALKPHPATISKAHKCTCCGAVIPKGSRVMVEGEATKVWITFGGSSYHSFRSLYYCNDCRKVEEA